MSKTFKLIVASILCSLCFSASMYADGPIQITRGGYHQGPIRKAPANIPIPFTASLESSLITYQSTISYTGVTVEIEDENGVVVESQTLNIVAGTAYTISVTGLDAGEYSIA
jgi:hypothetical protein